MPKDITPTEELLAEASEPRILELQQDLDSALRQVEKLKKKREWLRGVMIEAVHQNINSLAVKPVKQYKLKSGAGDEEVMVAMLSDWQVGKRTPNYNWEVCKRRIEHLAERTIRIARFHRTARPINKLHVWCIGDMVEGELIFPGQSHQIDASLYRQVMKYTPEILTNYLRMCLTEFDAVEVSCVIGNHGRIGGRSSRDMHPETNADLFFYEVMKLRFQNEPRIKFNIPEAYSEGAWYYVDRIGNYSCLLVHGDQIKGHSTFPFYGVAKKVLGWKALAADANFPMEDFRDVAMGHWHTPTNLYLNGITVRFNGTTESFNSWAQMQLASMGEPSQKLMFVHPEKGRVTAEYNIQLQLPGEDLAEVTNPDFISKFLELE